MVLLETDEKCPICEQQVVLNVAPKALLGQGVCNECGLPYRYSPKVVEEDEIETVSPLFDSEFIDWEVIEAYYSATGNMATTVGFCEATESQREKFEDWANEEFDMFWGYDPEEIDGLE